MMSLREGHRLTFLGDWFILLRLVWWPLPSVALFNFDILVVICSRYSPYPPPPTLKTLWRVLHPALEGF